MSATQPPELDEALRIAADLSLNGRTWAQALYFAQVRSAILRHTGWDAEEWCRALEAAKAAQQ